MNDERSSPEAVDDDRDGDIVVLQDDTGLRLTLLAWGATWWSLQLPVAGESRPRELLLGRETPAAQRANTAFFGATIGRYANRIAGATIEREGQRHALATLPGLNHQLHGGPGGFHARRWQVVSLDTRHVRYVLHSPDGDQGFPGALDVVQELRLEGDGVIELRYEARSTAATPIALTNHAYFNLDGLADRHHDPQARAPDVRDHRLQLASGWWMPVDAHALPLGDVEAVDGTPYDFRELHPLRRGPDGGDLDHAYLLDGAGPGPAAAAADLPLRPAARLQSRDGRVAMTIETTMPALQVYTGRFLARERGRDGLPLPAHAAIALEPGWLPDSPHHPEWPQPDCWLPAGVVWRHRIRYRFERTG